MDSDIEFNEVKFLTNNFQPKILSIHTAILHVSSNSFKLPGFRPGENSRVILKSCSFLNNYGTTRVAFFEGDVYLDVINTHFYDNNADYLLYVAYSFRNTDTVIPVTIVTTTLKVTQSTFSNNTGGQLIFLTGYYILVNISGLQITNNILLSGSDGLIVFKDW